MQTDPVASGVRARVLMLRGMGVVQGGLLSNNAILMLAEHARERHYDRDEVVFDEGAPIEFVHFIVRGQVTVSRKGAVVSVVDRSHPIGMISFLANDPHGAHAVANEPTHTLEIPAEVIRDVYEESFSFTRTALRASAGMLVRRRGNLPVAPDADYVATLGEPRTRRRTLTERIIELRSQPYFAEHNLDAVVDIARINEEIEIPAGQWLWRIDDPATHHIAINYGRVRCENQDGQAVTVGSTFYLGMMDALSQQPRLYSARAETDLNVYRTSVADFLSVLETHHALAMRLLAGLSGSLLPDNP